MDKTGIIILIEIFLLVSIDCTKEWKEYNGVWYFLSTTQFNFTDAISYCASEGAYIAIVTDKLQNDFLRKNKLFGLIGLTNTQFGDYNVSVTGNRSQIDDSFRDYWYWTVTKWPLRFLGQVNTINHNDYYVNLNEKDAKSSGGTKAASISMNEFWDIVDTAEEMPVVCEWQCDIIEITSDDSEINTKIQGVYKRNSYLKQRPNYILDAYKQLYYDDCGSKAWLLEVNDTRYIVLKETPHSPIYNLTSWTNKQNATLDIHLRCNATYSHSDFESKYTMHEGTCSGFRVYRNITYSDEYLYLYRIDDIAYWCIGSSSCDNNTINVCNSSPSPFPDELTGNWVQPALLDFSTASITMKTTSYDITTNVDATVNTFDSNVIIHISIGCAIGGLFIIIIITLITVLLRKRNSQKRHDTSNQPIPENNKPEFKDYSYVCARDLIEQSGTNNNIVINKSDYLRTENENSHLYSLEKLPQVNTSQVNDDISKQSTHINTKCDTYEDIEHVHDQNLTDSDKAKAKGLMNNSPKPVKPPRTFAHESVYSDEESPPPPLPSKCVLDSGKSSVFDNVVFDKDEGHDIELFENTIYETNVTK